MFPFLTDLFRPLFPKRSKSATHDRSISCCLFFFSCYFASAFRSADIPFHDFSERHSTLSEKRFPSRIFPI